jgi:hypothetical protein
VGCVERQSRGLLFLRSQVTEGSDPTTVVSSLCPLVLPRSTSETAIVVVESDALDDAGDFLGRGSALWHGGVHAWGFILPLMDGETDQISGVCWDR